MIARWRKHTTLRVLFNHLVGASEVPVHGGWVTTLTVSGGPAWDYTAAAGVGCSAGCSLIIKAILHQMPITHEKMGGQCARVGGCGGGGSRGRSVQRLNAPSLRFAARPVRGPPMAWAHAAWQPALPRNALNTRHQRSLAAVRTPQPRARAHQLEHAGPGRGGQSRLKQSCFFSYSIIVLLFRSETS